MVIFMLFIGIYCLVSGFLYLLNTFLWRIEAGENFLEYGMNYAQLRHDFYTHEFIFGCITILTGAMLFLISLWYIKKKK